ncbi:ATP-binding protein [Chryseolinea soli]|uniref:DNA mismatch repair protein n=1 Tax=Chryseolinea soli TaxID=2321403 RepID=A0A385SKH6_9BACT|nr:ATP-binding protein [Chryseolinea soli]AYB30976.1 DNA mismatch repair protein [Chryseolinea soli]
MAKKIKLDEFSFNISLSVLNHLGRNLYRSFITVLGEAISNAWDADAKNVWIYIDKSNNNFVIKDDGIGMTADDFQNKFLKIGYSKRQGGQSKSSKGRPFIGRKGIGKLALLSCAERITVISKTKKGEYVGGVIDNSGLDLAITNDLTPQQYPLGSWREKSKGLKKYMTDHGHGSIIHFEDIKGGIKSSLAILRKLIALYFRFSLLDKSFNIFIDNNKISLSDLDDLSEKTEFLWNVNEIEDPYVKKQLANVKERKTIDSKSNIRGFLATVGKPRDLNIMNLDERVSVDLFVNGRLREKNILKHIPTARIVEDYLYGQIHFDELDDSDKDRFTSDREGVVADDTKYQLFLKNFRDEIMKKVIDDWDRLRIKYRLPGDSENPRMTVKERTSRDLFNAVSAEYTPPEKSKNRTKVLQWVDDLEKDAEFNFGSYAECFISENLVRKYISDQNISLSTEAQKVVKRWKEKETENKGKGNLSIEIRQKGSDLSYLSMDDLSYLVDKGDQLKQASLSRDANEYKPIRDALAHTALLTEKAKRKLNSVYENIKDRVKILLSSGGTIK